MVEAAFDGILSAPAYKHRVTVLNSTYNMGCSGFVERYLNSDKPIPVCHFCPDLRIGVKTQLLGQKGLNVQIVDERLVRMLMSKETTVSKLEQS